ncbi:MAG: hypothetical protein WCP06_09285, partial [Verrucomicrobiota bacterium]
MNPNGILAQSPGLARRGPTLGSSNPVINPNGVVARGAADSFRLTTTRSGLASCNLSPRVARSSQPWAHNPFGIVLVILACLFVLTGLAPAQQPGAPEPPFPARMRRPGEPTVPAKSPAPLVPVQLPPVVPGSAKSQEKRLEAASTSGSATAVPPEPTPLPQPSPSRTPISIPAPVLPPLPAAGNRQFPAAN